MTSKEQWSRVSVYILAVDAFLQGCTEFFFIVSSNRCIHMVHYALVRNILMDKYFPVAGGSEGRDKLVLQ